MDKLFGKQGETLVASSSHGTQLITMKGTTTSTTEITVSSDNPDAQKKVDERNDKIANKLLNNLGRLQDMSSVIQKRMQDHDDEIQTKQKKDQQLKASQNLTMEQQLNKLMSEKEHLKNQVDNRQSVLKEKEENHEKTKQDLSNLAEERSKAIQDVEEQRKQQILEKDKIIKQLTEDIAKLKDELKDLRAQRKGLDDRLLEMQEMVLKKKLDLKEISQKAADKDKLKADKKAELDKIQQENEDLQKLLDSLKDQIKKQQELNDELKKKLADLMAEKDKLKEQAYLLPHDLEQVKDKLANLKKEIEKLKQDAEDLAKAIEQKKAFLENENKQNADLQNDKQHQILTHQIEKEGRDQLMKLQDLDNRLKKLQVNSQESHRILQQLVEEGGMKNTELDKNIEKMLGDITNALSKRNEIKNEILVMDEKLLKDNDLPNDVLKAYIEKIKAIDGKVVNLTKDTEGLEQNYAKRQEEYSVFVKQVQDTYQKKIVALAAENKDLVGKITTLQKDLGDKVTACDKRLDAVELLDENQVDPMVNIKVKISQFLAKSKQVTNNVKTEEFKLDRFNKSSSKLNADYIPNYLNLNQELEKQRDRLKQILDSDLGDLMKKLLEEIENALKDLEKLAEENKKNGSRKKLDALKGLGDEVDKKIDELQNRMDELNKEIAKLDPSEYGTLKDQMQKELDQLQKELDECKDKNDKLKAEIEKLAKLSDEELAKVNNLDTLKDGFDSLLNHELPPIEKGLDDLEKKLKNAVNRKKNGVKQDCLDSLNNDKIKLKQLDAILDKIEKEIIRIDDETENLERAYRYKDLERDHNLDDKIKTELKGQNEVLVDLKAARDDLKKTIADLENKIDQDANSSVPQEEQLKNWGKHLEESQKLEKDIDAQLDKAKGQQTKLDTTGSDLNELDDKFKQKDKLHKKANELKKQKLAKLELIKRTSAGLDKKFANVDETLNNINIPNDGSELSEQYQDKKERLDALKNKLKGINERIGQVENKINDICKPLGEMSDREVLSPELQKVIEELNKLDVLVQELQDDLKDLQQDLDALLDDINKFLDKTKNLQLDEAEKAWNINQKKVTDTDKKYTEADGKLQKLVQKLKEGMRQFSDDDEILKELKKFKGESDGIDDELKKLDGQRNTLGGKNKQSKDLLDKYKANKKNPPTQEEIQSLVSQFKQQSKDSDKIYDDLQKLIDDLDKKLDYLEKFLKKGGQLQDLFKQYQKLANDLNKGFRNFSKNLDDALTLASLLKEVLFQMEQGQERDYLSKGDFIQQRQQGVADQDDILAQLNTNRDIMTDALDELKANKIDNIVKCDLATLNDQLPRYEELLANLKQYEAELKDVVEALGKIRTDIHIADCPKNIKGRETELEKFSKKLKQYESDLHDIKRLSVQNPIYNTTEDVKLIEKNILIFTEDKVKFQRILKQELQPYEQTPSKLEPLEVLKEAIEKIRELGDKIAKAIDFMNQALADINKLRKQIGGQDSQNRWKGLELKEEDLRNRLSAAKKRFKLIYKGGDDCDGYTSNPEETIFVESLLNDKPDVNDKQMQILEAIDDIQAQIFEIKKDIDDFESEDFDQQNQEIVGKLQAMEDKILNAESDLIFLEKLADNLEEKFMAMQAQRKLDKRQTEINEVAQVTQHFNERLRATQDAINQDLKTIKNQQRSLEKMGVDPAEDKNKEDLINLKEELNDYLGNINEIFGEIETLDSKRKEAQQFFDDKIVKDSPYKKKAIKKEEHFYLLDLNSQIKRKILDLIKLLKSIQNDIRDIKRKYQQLRANYDNLLSRKMYSSMKGDLIDEQVGDYINKLNFDVPIKKTGNNQYTIGSRKIIASLINEKLMVRVGGGYVGMDEFMMVYGSAELLRIQREEMTKFSQDFDFIKSELMSQYFINDLGEDSIDQDQSQMEISQLKSKLKQDYHNRKGKLYRHHDIGERTSSEGRKPVVGILDARNALKKNIQTIVTSETCSTMSQKVGKSRMSMNVGQTSRNTPHGKYIDKALQSQKSGNTGSGSAAAVDGFQRTQGSFTNAIPPKRNTIHVKAQAQGSLIGTGAIKPPTNNPTPRQSIKKTPQQE